MSEFKFSHNWEELASTLREPLTKEDLFPSKNFHRRVVCCLQTRMRDIWVTAGLLEEELDGSPIYRTLIQADVGVKLPALSLLRKGLLSGIGKLFGSASATGDAVFDKHYKTQSTKLGISLLSEEARELLLQIRDFDFESTGELIQAKNGANNYNYEVPALNMLPVIEAVAVLGERALELHDEWDSIRQQVNGRFDEHSVDHELGAAILFEKQGVRFRVSHHYNMTKLTVAAATEPFSFAPQPGFSSVGVELPGGHKLYSQEPEKTKARLTPELMHFFESFFFSLSSDGKEVDLLLLGDEERAFSPKKILLMIELLLGLLAPINATPYR